MIDLDDLRDTPVIGELLVVPTVLIDLLANGGDLVWIVLDILLANIPLLSSLIGTIVSLGTEIPLIDLQTIEALREPLIVAVGAIYAVRLANKLTDADDSQA
jgi:predicted membrane protein